MPPNPSLNPPPPGMVVEVDRTTAARIIERHQTEAPVDVRAIAADFGINVYSVDLGENVSGVLRRGGEWAGPSGYVILVHRQHHLNRQRFTVAHELGHFVLHRSQVDEREIVQEDEFYRAFPGPLEREANNFAADVLMPWTLINRLSESGIKDLPGLALRLAVSKQALAVRLGLPYDQGGWE